MFHYCSISLTFWESSAYPLGIKHSMEEPQFIHVCVHVFLIQIITTFILFPTCQVRVVRFYQSCSSPPRLAVLLRLLLLLLLLLRLLLQFLLDHVFRLANSSQALCQLPSSVCTAGPQPASCPAQCAPLDLNRGPAQLSVHRWTSTAR